LDKIIDQWFISNDGTINAEKHGFLQ
jgi:hypothetical protein